MLGRETVRCVAAPKQDEGGWAMAVSLQAAIDLAIQNSALNHFGSRAFVTMSMHDDSGLVLFGHAEPEFVPDLPLQRTPAGTIPTTSGGGSNDRHRQLVHEAAKPRVFYAGHSKAGYEFLSGEQSCQCWRSGPAF